MADYLIVMRELGATTWQPIIGGPALVSEAEVFGYLERKPFQPEDGYEYAILRPLQYIPPATVGRWR